MMMMPLMMILIIIIFYHYQKQEAVAVAAATAAVTRAAAAAVAYLQENINGCCTQETQLQNKHTLQSERIPVLQVIQNRPKQRRSTDNINVCLPDHYINIVSIQFR